MSSLATVILSPCSWAISSRTGATILQGPHQVAQKSTRTGLSLFSTSSEKVESVTVTGLPIGDPPEDRRSSRVLDRVVGVGAGTPPGRPVWPVRTPRGPARG